MTYTYTQNTPNANDTVAKTQPIIKNNFNYISTWGLFDHRFSASTTDVLTGAHNKITFPANIAAPGIGTAVSVLYPSNGTGTAGIALQNASGSFDITGRNPSVPAAPGEIETCLPGKVLLKTGLATNNLSGTNTVTVTFSTPFPTDCRTVNVTPRKADGNFVTAAFSFAVTNITSSGFVFSYVNSGANYQGFYWTAIGTAI
jgi:hypothetical protein